MAKFWIVGYVIDTSIEDEPSETFYEDIVQAETAEDAEAEVYLANEKQRGFLGAWACREASNKEIEAYEEEIQRYMADSSYFTE